MKFKPNNKILFINPPQSTDIKQKYTNFKFPLGFLYMAGILEKNGFEVKILDCPLHYTKRKIIDKETMRIGLLPEDIKKIIIEFKPSIIGVSCAYTAYEQDSFDVIKIIKDIEKEENKKYLVVVGGAHTSANPEYVLRNKNIDIVVIGEGEETILEIAKNYINSKPINKIKSTALMEKNKIKINKKRDFIQNLDSLQAAWHLLDMKLYFNHPDNSIATMRSPSIDIITSRGCPAHCVFCSIHTVWGRKWRGRSAKNVVDEIEFLKNKYNVSQFRIQDDNMTLDKKRTIEICNEIIKRKLDIKWDTPNGVAFWALDEEILKKMKEAGCYRITFGIESGSAKSQQYIRKIVDLKKINELINTCHRLGMWVCSTFIIGFPYETIKEINETKNYIINSKINFPFVYVAQPYQGTEMYNDFKKENLLKEFKTTSNVKKSQYNTKHFSNNELIALQTGIYKGFYLKKVIKYLNIKTFYNEFLSKIKTTDDIKYVIKNFTNIFLH